MNQPKQCVTIHMRADRDGKLVLIPFFDPPLTDFLDTAAVNNDVLAQAAKMIALAKQNGVRVDL